MPDDDALAPEQIQLAQLALTIHDREVRLFGLEPKRSEVVLAEVGLPLTVIAKLSGRNYEAVKTAVRRHRASATTEAKKSTKPRETKAAK